MATKRKTKTKKKTAKKKQRSKKAGYECFHCKLWLTEKTKKGHDCWSTTEEKLTQHLPEELRDAWERVRETAVAFGEQRIYASLKSIMFARKYCYFFVRPQKKYLEVCFFLPRELRHSLVHKTHASSKTKVSHLVRITHRDQIERPLTDWLLEAYEFCPVKAIEQKTETTKKPKKSVIYFKDL